MKLNALNSCFFSSMQRCERRIIRYENKEIKKRMCMKNTFLTVHKRPASGRRIRLVTTGQ